MLQAATLTIHDAVEDIRARRSSALELWNACSAQVERLNPRLNAIRTPIQQREGSLDHAPAWSYSGDALLPGIPIEVKDLYETGGVRTTAGSLFFKDYIPDSDAEAVRRLRAQGARSSARPTPMRSPWASRR